MIFEDQAAAIRLLMNPATHGGVGPVETIETHISRVFLVGNRAYKMKRAVKLPYVDSRRRSSGLPHADAKSSSIR